VFSDERYAKHGTSPEALLSYSNRAVSVDEKNAAASIENITALLDEAVSEVSDALSTALELIQTPANAGSVSLPVQIMCHIRASQTQLWKKRKTDLLVESITLTPLRKFFIAYRCKRRFVKTRQAS